ncbi:hypothetical protein OBBRIDRAFT_887526 [Obba rivulosa]|uniref:MYND-type domain-containing protein n=1 Tax=Obba rivulosa TaxID=1052685 RepID=A0A8E2ATM2_9APHY|nr:hypothetical protein OBBRIDRAFT_887526 [Obba rivulosa]
MVHICVQCDQPARLCCSACSTTGSMTWYCSESCQKNHWICHIFKCKRRTREINTGDHLALAVYRSRLPLDPQTRLDYGFDRAFTTDVKLLLFGMYRVLLIDFNLSSQKLHKWRLHGILLEKIEAALISPEGPRSPYYVWLQGNSWILDTSQPSVLEDMGRGQEAAAIHNTGIGDSVTPTQFIGILDTWPQTKRDCLELWIDIYCFKHPSPQSDCWVTFGFCVCDTENDELRLCRIYRSLRDRCSFDEFWRAYDMSSLMALFDSKECVEARSQQYRHLEGVLRGPPGHVDSIWELKRLAMGGSLDGTSRAIFDYGMDNCKEQAERNELAEIYIKFFARRLGDPMDLHKAACEGKIYEYLSGLMKVKKKFKSLMKKIEYPFQFSSLESDRAAHRSVQTSKS